MQNDELSRETQMKYFEENPQLSELLTKLLEN